MEFLKRLVQRVFSAAPVPSLEISAKRHWGREKKPPYHLEIANYIKKELSKNNPNIFMLVNYNAKEPGKNIPANVALKNDRKIGTLIFSEKVRWIFYYPHGKDGHEQSVLNQNGADRIIQRILETASKPEPDLDPDPDGGKEMPIAA